MNAAIIDFRMTVYGRSCHGAHPDQGIDPIVAAAHIITAIQTVNSRIISPTTPVVVTVGSIHGGHSSNSIPGEVSMEGTIRVLDNETGRNVKKNLERIVRSVAAAWDCRVDMEFTDSFPALINDNALTRQLMRVASNLFGTDKVVEMDTPSMGGDDFAYFSNAAKSSFFNIGTARPGEPCESLHSETYAPSDECIVPGLALIIAGVWKILEG